MRFSSRPWSQSLVWARAISAGWRVVGEAAPLGQGHEIGGETAEARVAGRCRNPAPALRSALSIVPAIDQQPVVTTP